MEEDLAIGREAHLPHIREVEVRVLVHRPVTACQDLPQPGQPGLHRMAFVLPALVPVDDVHQLGAGPDEAHVAARHVPKLGQLVEAPLAQEPAEWGEPWISRVLVRDPAVRRVLDAGRSATPEIVAEKDDLIVVDPHVEPPTELNPALHHVFVVHEDRIVEMRDYPDRDTALAALETPW